MARSVALVYVRKSLVVRGQPDPASPAMQEDACRERAKALHLKPELYSDSEGHHSGGDENRPAWQKVRARLGDPDVAALVVYAWSRAVRNTKLLLQLVDDCEKAGVRFISVSQNIDSKTADGRLILTILAGVDESEVTRSSERRIESINFLRRHKGRHYGLAPFGCVREHRNGDLILVANQKPQPNGTDYDCLKHLYETYLELGSLLQVQRALNRDGWKYRDRRGGLRDWTPDDVRRCIASHWLYSGYVTIGRAYRDPERPAEVIRGSHAPILPDGLTSAVAARMAAFKKDGPRQHLPLLYPLTGVLYCACGVDLTGEYADGKRRYRHNRQPCALDLHRRMLADDLEQRIIHRIAHLKIPKRILDVVGSEITRILAVDGAGGVEAERLRLTQQIERAKDLYQMGDLTKEEYLARRDALRAQMPEPSTPVVPESFVVSGALSSEDISPANLRDLVRVLYDRIVVRVDGTLDYEAKEWCKEWA